MENSNLPEAQESENKFPSSSNEFFRLPNSPASNSMMNAVNHAGENMSLFADRLAITSHSTKLDFFDRENAQKLVFKTDNIESTIQLDNVDLFSKSKKPLKKILTYTLVKLSQTNINEDPNNDIKITFPLQDFVDLGSYTSLATARQAFNQAKNPLTSIKVEGLVKDKKDQHAITDSGIEVLFTGAHIKKGQVEIYLNKRINWQLFALQYFSILPKTYFSLKDNAADALLNISILARKRITELRRNGFFTMSFRTLQQILDLPDENKTKNPGRDIKEAILTALDEINKNNDNDMHVETVFDPNANILLFLDEGYAKIYLRNQFAEYFTSLADRKNAKIEETMRKREEIAEKVRIKQLSQSK